MTEGGEFSALLQDIADLEAKTGKPLTGSQKAIRAIRLPLLARGQRSDKVDGFTALQLANVVGVNRAVVVQARRVAKEGTPEEVRLIEAGELSVEAVYRPLLRGDTAAQRASDRAQETITKGSNPRRVETMRMEGMIWSGLRDALEGLSGLPATSDVLKIASNAAKREIVNRHLGRAKRWLDQFTEAWEASQPSEGKNHEAQ